MLLVFLFLFHSSTLFANLEVGRDIIKSEEIRQQILSIEEDDKYFFVRNKENSISTLKIENKNKFKIKYEVKYQFDGIESTESIELEKGHNKIEIGNPSASFIKIMLKKQDGVLIQEASNKFYHKILSPFPWHKNFANNSKEDKVTSLKNMTSPYAHSFLELDRKKNIFLKKGRYRLTAYNFLNDKMDYNIEESIIELKDNNGIKKIKFTYNGNYNQLLHSKTNSPYVLSRPLTYFFKLDIDQEISITPNLKTLLSITKELQTNYLLKNINQVHKREKLDYKVFFNKNLKLNENIYSEGPVSFFSSIFKDINSNNEAQLLALKSKWEEQEIIPIKSVVKETIIPINTSNTSMYDRDPIHVYPKKTLFSRKSYEQSYFKVDSKPNFFNYYPIIKLSLYSKEEKSFLKIRCGNFEHRLKVLEKKEIVDTPELFKKLQYPNFKIQAIRTRYIKFPQKCKKVEIQSQDNTEVFLKVTKLVEKTPLIGKNYFHKSEELIKVFHQKKHKNTFAYKTFEQIHQMIEKDSKVFSIQGPSPIEESNCKTKTSSMICSIRKSPSKEKINGLVQRMPNKKLFIFKLILSLSMHEKLNNKVYYNYIVDNWKILNPTFSFKNYLAYLYKFKKIDLDYLLINYMKIVKDSTKDPVVHNFYQLLSPIAQKEEKKIVIEKLIPLTESNNSILSKHKQELFSTPLGNFISKNFLGRQKKLNLKFLSNKTYQISIYPVHKEIGRSMNLWISISDNKSPPFKIPIFNNQSLGYIRSNNFLGTPKSFYFKFNQNTYLSLKATKDIYFTIKQKSEESEFSTNKEFCDTSFKSRTNYFFTNTYDLTSFKSKCTKKEKSNKTQENFFLHPSLTKNQISQLKKLNSSVFLITEKNKKNRNLLREAFKFYKENENHSFFLQSFQVLKPYIEWSPVSDIRRSKAIVKRNTSNNYSENEDLYLYREILEKKLNTDFVVTSSKKISLKIPMLSSSLFQIKARLVCPSLNYCHRNNIIINNKKYKINSSKDFWFKTKLNKSNKNEIYLRDPIPGQYLVLNIYNQGRKINSQFQEKKSSQDFYLNGKKTFLNSRNNNIFRVSSLKDDIQETRYLNVDKNKKINIPLPLNSLFKISKLDYKKNVLLPRYVKSPSFFNNRKIKEFFKISKSNLKTKKLNDKVLNPYIYSLGTFSFGLEYLKAPQVDENRRYPLRTENRYKISHHYYDLSRKIKHKTSYVYRDHEQMNNVHHLRYKMMTPFWLTPNTNYISTWLESNHYFQRFNITNKTERSHDIQFGMSYKYLLLNHLSVAPYLLSTYKFQSLTNVGGGGLHLLDPNIFSSFRDNNRPLFTTGLDFKWRHFWDLEFDLKPFYSFYKDNYYGIKYKINLAVNKFIISLGGQQNFNIDNISEIRSKSSNYLGIEKSFWFYNQHRIKVNLNFGINQTKDTRSNHSKFVGLGLTYYFSEGRAYYDMMPEDDIMIDYQNFRIPHINRVQ